MPSALCTYLHDHHAGSVVIGEMLRDALSRPVEDHETLEWLEREISTERDLLEQLADKFGSRENGARTLVAWAAEKFARLKVSASVQPLRHLEFLDLLLTGVRGKLGLWEVLSANESSAGDLSWLNLPALISSAEKQLAAITECRSCAFARLLREP